MTPNEFRQHGRAVIDWIADYMEQVEQYPVFSQVQPGDIRAQLPASPPQKGEPFDRILDDVSRVIMPGITHWQSPNFFAYFPSNNSGPSILGELLSAGLGVQGMLWATSPACTELETHVLDWLVDVLDLPRQFKSGYQSHSESGGVSVGQASVPVSASAGGGVIQDTASSAVLSALLAARERATAGQSNLDGVGAGASSVAGAGVGAGSAANGQLVAYTSPQSHSSVEKAVRIAGLGSNNLRLIDVDEKFAMKPESLAAAVAADRAAGRVPCFVSATIGTTSSNAVDPLPAIGRFCRENNIWLHVDGAMAGTAGLCPEFRGLFDGLEYADSYAFNPHKWMFTNFDCTCFFVADRASLIRTLSILPEYLRNKATESGAVIDYRDWHIQLGRRFRALKLWFVIRSFGIEGLQQRIRKHVELTREFVTWLQSDDRFEIVAPVPLNLVCFRHRGGDEINQQILDRLNRSGRMYLSHTRLNDKLTLRLCIAQTNVERRHVEQAWQLIREAANAASL